MDIEKSKRKFPAEISAMIAEMDKFKRWDGVAHEILTNTKTLAAIGQTSIKAWSEYSEEEFNQDYEKTIKIIKENYEDKCLYKFPARIAEIQEELFKAVLWWKVSEDIFAHSKVIFLSGVHFVKMWSWAKPEEAAADFDMACSLIESHYQKYLEEKHYDDLVDTIFKGFL